MIQRIAVVGLALLSSLALCAIAAQSASAAKGINTTGYTCVPEPMEKGDFTDPHCETVSTGKGAYTHQLIPLGETHSFGATNEKVTKSTKESEPAVIKSKAGLVSIEITCQSVKGNTKESVVHNVESEIEGKKRHTFTGVAIGEFTSCMVNKPAFCTVKEPIEPKTTFEGVEGLGAGANEMGVEYKGSGAEETFAEIEFKNKEKEGCALNGKTFKVKGSLIGTSGPTTESSQTNKSAGATIVISPKKEMQKLKLGVEPAELSFIVQPQTPPEEKEIPVSITTTT
jgi:hypothetical protein